MREGLHPNIETDQSTQPVEHIGIAAKFPEQLNINFRAVFKCIQNARLKHSMAKCHFGTKGVDLLERTLTPK